VRSIAAEASSLPEIAAAFAAVAGEKADGVIIGAAPLFALHRPRIAELAIKYRMPSIYGNRGYVEAGGLMSYGYEMTENYRQAAIYVDKILKGAKPGDLPVQEPKKLELVVNLKTAKALGLTIPQTILLRADELID
jgi:putative ABC transport system substrate-binding protein